MYRMGPWLPYKSGVGKCTGAAGFAGFEIDGAGAGAGAGAGRGDGFGEDDAPSKSVLLLRVSSLRNTNSGVSSTAAFSLAYPAHIRTTVVSDSSSALSPAVIWIRSMSSRFLPTARLPSHVAARPRNVPPAVD